MYVVCIVIACIVVIGLGLAAIFYLAFSYPRHRKLSEIYPDNEYVEWIANGNVGSYREYCKDRDAGVS